MLVRTFAPLIAALSLLTGCPTPAAEVPDEEITDPTWSEDVQPILSAYCGDCHEGANAINSGGHNWLDSLDDAQVLAGAASCDGKSRAECIPGRIERGEMPAPAGCLPGEDGCITELQLETVKNWVDAGMPE